MLRKKFFRGGKNLGFPPLRHEIGRSGQGIPKLIDLKFYLWFSYFGNQKIILFEARSEDGRGPLFWAWEYGNAEALSILHVAGLNM